MQEPDETGVNRSVLVEFGPNTNWATVQGSDEDWVLGKAEKLKRDIHVFEHTNTTKFQRIGIGVNQLLLLGSIIFLPSLNSLNERAALMLMVVGTIYSVNWLHNRYLPNSAIYVRQRKKSIFTRIKPQLVSWAISVTAGIIVALFAAWLNGNIKIPRLT